MTIQVEDIERVGRAIYKKLRSEMEANHWGKMVVIDVKTGDYEIADDDLTATMRLMKKNPDALTWGERVGIPRALLYQLEVSLPGRLTGEIP